MAEVLALRPFAPAKDFALSRRCYAALGFATPHAGEGVAILELGGFGFILRDFYVQAFAENCMVVQLLVRDVAAWWSRVDGAELVATLAVPPPRAPAMQP